MQLQMGEHNLENTPEYWKTYSWILEDEPSVPIKAYNI